MKKDLRSENVKKIAEDFPMCITEIKDKDGNLKKVVDFEKLKDLFSDDIREKEEAYEFTWAGKREALHKAFEYNDKILRPVVEDSLNFFDTQNIYIEGDNLDVLKILRRSYFEKVKMIYIDPPYNTGHDFIYKDDRKQKVEEYQEELGLWDEEDNMLFENNESTNGRFHSDWCSMIYSRLLLARDLLRPDGVIFISIDDNEVASLRKICDEIFGEDNFVAEIPWQSRASIQNDTDFSINHEYILTYGKFRRRENRRLKESNVKEWYKTDSFVCKPLPLDKSKFSNPDNDPRGLWKADPFDAPNIRPNLTYPITNPNTGTQHLPPSGRHWRISPEKFANALQDNRIIWTNCGQGRPQLKVFYEEKKNFGSVDNSWFSSEKIGTTTQGTKELMSLFEKSSYFDSPKPTNLLNKLINLANIPTIFSPPRVA